MIYHHCYRWYILIHSVTEPPPRQPVEDKGSLHGLMASTRRAASFHAHFTRFFSPHRACQSCHRIGPRMHPIPSPLGSPSLTKLTYKAMYRLSTNGNPYHTYLGVIATPTREYTQQLCSETYEGSYLFPKVFSTRGPINRYDDSESGEE